MERRAQQVGRGLALAPAALAALLYAPTLGFGWLDLGDPAAVTGNPLVTRPSSEHLGRLVLGPLDGRWEPLARALLVAEHAVGGGRAWVFHAVSALLHATAAGLVALVLAPALGGRGRPLAHARGSDGGDGPLARAPGFDGLGPAVGAGLLFAVHPLAVEPVAWVAAQARVLALPLLLGAVLLARGVAPAGRPVRWGRLAAALACGAGALAAHAAAVALPLLLLLDLLLGRGERPRRRAAAALLPFGLLALAFALLRATTCAPLDPPAPLPVAAEGGPFVRLHLAVLALAALLSRVAVPSGLGVAYDPGAIGALGHAGAWVAAAVVGVLAVALVRRERRLLYGLGWLVLPLLPSLDGVARDGWAADAWAYPGLVGAGALLAALGPTRLATTRERAGAAVLAAVGVAWLVAALGHLPAWRSSEALWAAQRARRPTHRLALPRLAARAFSAGDAARGRALLEEAFAAHPFDPAAYRVLAERALAAGDPERARLLLRDWQGEVDLAADHAALLLAEGEPAEAAALVARARADDPGRLDLRRLAGRAALARREWAAAADHLAAVVRADPRRPADWLDLARARARLDPEAARAALVRARALGADPDEAAAVAALLTGP